MKLEFQKEGSAIKGWVIFDRKDEPCAIVNSQEAADNLTAAFGGRHEALLFFKFDNGAYFRKAPDYET